MDIASLYQRYKESGNVSTDTRRITPGALFFSLKGPRFNANELAHEALAKGASYVVIDEEKWCDGSRYILVNNCLQALQQLAAYHRRQLAIPVIAITGSNGKTTTKELLATVLQTRYTTRITTGNLNNHIGVPLTLLSIDEKTEIAVVEMGANHVGEIALLCRIAAPTHGAITNIGRAHIGNFGSMEDIVRAKGELYSYLSHKDKAVWVNAQNKVLVTLSKQLKNPMFYPRRGDYFHCELVRADPFVRVRVNECEEIQTQLVGAYNVENIALALCIGSFFNVNIANAKAALERYKPSDMRSQIMVRGSNTIILDAYNANPTSMEAAIKNLSKMKANRKAAILGDMYELGEGSERYHKETLRLLDKYDIDEAYLCGELFYRIATKGSKVHFFPSVHSLRLYLESNPIKSTTVLIKGSRSMRMESLLDFI